MYVPKGAFFVASHADLYSKHKEESGESEDSVCQGRILCLWLNYEGK